jgi:hypothetical protein
MPEIEDGGLPTPQLPEHSLHGNFKPQVEGLANGARVVSA